MTKESDVCEYVLFVCYVCVFVCVRVCVCVCVRVCVRESEFVCEEGGGENSFNLGSLLCVWYANS